MFIGSKEDLTTKRFLLDDVSFVNEIESGNLTIQTRYNSQDLPCELNQINESECEVILNSPTLGVAPGQFGVIYQGTKVVGGGRISSKILESADD